MRHAQLGLAIVASAFLIACQRQAGAPPANNRVFHFRLVRELDADGGEGANIALGELPLTSVGGGPLHFSVVGCDDTRVEKTSLSLISKVVSERADSIVVSGPTKGTDGNGWILYLAANLPDRQLDFDIAGVERVAFADGSQKSWPLVLQRTAVALDVTYSDDGKTARINKLLQVSLER